MSRKSSSIFIFSLIPIFFVSQLFADQRGLDGPPEKMGEWQTVMPCNLNSSSLGMQSVHTVLLPNGKVLMVNGSSLRDAASSVRFPASNHNGVFSRSNFAKLTWDEMFNINNNVGIYDPSKNTFYKIDGPRLSKKLMTPSSGPNKDSLNNDLFCSGQQHLPDGRVLFVGGTQFYTPYTGAKTSYIFDWQTEKWIDAGLLKDGHWYPSMVPLSDGRLMVFSGLSDKIIKTPNATVDSPGVPYPSSIIEIFDPALFDPQFPQKSWSSIDARDLPNNPWQRPVRSGSARTDSFVLYPRIYPLPDGRIFLSHEGAIQLYNDTGTPVNNRNTYLLDLGPPIQSGISSKAHFTYGPDKPDVYRHYGNALVDPVSNNLFFLGGQRGPKRGYDGYNDTFPEPGTRATRDLNIYHLPSKEHADGHWEHIPDFLGDNRLDGRVNHLTVILPTRQLLVTNGGNLSLGRPLFSPILYTPDQTAKGGYRAAHMNWAKQPRLYHNSALLLPDGRVLSVGGQNPRAKYNIDTGEVTMNSQLGEYVIPNEIWQAEIFSPPYLYLPGPRPEIKNVKQALNIIDGGAYIETGEPTEQLSYEKTYVVDIASLPNYCALSNGSLVLIKLGSVTHAWDSGQRLIELDMETYRSNITNQLPDLPAATFTLPKQGPTTPPGYYMMFYNNCNGKPSKAKMIHLGN